MPNIVYIATSMDGYIADKDGGLDWLSSIPNPDHDDFGFADFIAEIDALVMGRNTFEAVCSFNCEWPYPKPVFVYSSTLISIPEKLTDKAKIINGSVTDVIAVLHERGFKRLYIDGGKTVQSFLEHDLIDELIVSQLPILLGGGTPLFGSLTRPLEFEHVATEVLLGQIVKSHYRRKPRSQNDE